MAEQNKPAEKDKSSTPTLVEKAEPPLDEYLESQAFQIIGAGDPPPPLPAADPRKP